MYVYPTCRDIKCTTIVHIVGLGGMVGFRYTYLNLVGFIATTSIIEGSPCWMELTMYGTLVFFSDSFNFGSHHPPQKSGWRISTLKTLLRTSLFKTRLYASNCENYSFSNDNIDRRWGIKVTPILSPPIDPPILTLNVKVEPFAFYTISKSTSAVHVDLST